MPMIKNVSGEARIIPSLGGRYVKNDQEIEVVADAVYGFTQTSDWEAVDEAAQQAHNEAHQAYLERRSEELGGVPVDDNGAPLPPVELTEPAGNASREAWAEYVWLSGLATEDEIEDKGRDELRDTYSKPVDDTDDDTTDPPGDEPAGDEHDDTDGSN